MTIRKPVVERLRGMLRRFSRDRSGNIVILFALTAPAVVGVLGLGSEAGYLFLKRAGAQAAADFAAISAANAARGGTAALQLEGKAIAAQLGFQDGVRGVVVTVNNPPSAGAKAGDASAVEVVVSARLPPMLSRALHPDDYIVTARAVALAATPNSGGCVLALDPAADAAVGIGGSTYVDMPTCNVYSNSASSSSIASGGGGFLSANIVAAVGAVSGGGITATSIVSGAAAQSNPYAGLTIPAFSGCAAAPTKDDVQTLNPGVYCGGVTINAGQTVNLNPGVYIFDGGVLKIVGGALRGAGVTLVLTASGARGSNTPATIAVGGNSIIDLSAPATGEFAGVAVFIDPRTALGVKQKFNGGATQYVGGAIVAPTSSVEFSGNGVSGTGKSCTQLVANQVTFTGNSAIGTECATYAVKSFGASGRTALVE